MEVQEIQIYMNRGEGELSYYKNSLYQKQVISMARPIVEEAVAELLHQNLPADYLRMADMGSSSGPSALLPLWGIIETIASTCRRLDHQKAPPLQFFLNDLAGNDFNTVFRSLLSGFYQKLGEDHKFDKFGPCFIAAVPGSFHGRLFPDNSLHFVHSSYSLHFLSRVPEGLVSESGEALNKGNICLAETSHPSVHNAYLDQFEKDFSSFLRSHASEVISGGRMVLTIMGRSDRNPSCKYGCEVWQLIGASLKDMVDEGKIEESLLDSFNVPIYCPSAEVVRKLIQREGSFNIDRPEQFEVNWDVHIEDGNGDLNFDKWARGRCVSKLMRAVAESMLTSQFGAAIMDDLYHLLSFKYADCLERGTGLCHNLVISMAKK
ncbi:hypothetical protein Tsubulata_022490 [Turnera subulata]|uniref:Jasmonate O-methyltransferase n=1 Tax=Turnera subulata TaxID=218843 RepID=A0A9Q0FMQ5_9ROSI|nr:hypothetical protein Tsubulata_022490 [Turnera subulata]